MAQYLTHHSPPEREAEAHQVKATLDSQPMPAHACGSASETQDADNLIAIMVRPGQRGGAVPSTTLQSQAHQGTVSHTSLSKSGRGGNPLKATSDSRPTPAVQDCCAPETQFGKN